MIFNSVNYRFNNTVKVITMSRVDEVDELISVISTKYLNSKKALPVEISTLIYDIVLHVVESSNDDNDDIVCAVIKDYNKVVLFYVLCDKTVINTIGLVNILTDISLSILCYTAGLAEDSIGYMRCKIEKDIIEILGE